MNTKSQDNYFTYQEIVRQQAGWEKVLSYSDTETASLHKILHKYRRHVWVFAGCGTSFYLAQTASVLADEFLPELGAVMTRWNIWFAEHPTTKVLKESSN